MTRLLDAVEWCAGSHTMNRVRWRLESLRRRASAVRGWWAS